MTFADQVIRFFEELAFNVELPSGVEVMNPYQKEETMEAVRKFYTKYYSDSNKRTFIIGINPGRFGAGVTGISFTDTVRLEKECNIEHRLQPTTELSSEYIYNVIGKMNGPEAFFSRFYITSTSPLGFTKDGKNYNYYDSSALLKATLPYMKEQLAKQIEFGANRDVAFSLGSGKNYKWISEINEQMGRPFKKVVAINHPRFVMQYRRKHLQEEIELFINSLNNR